MSIKQFDHRFTVHAPLERVVAFHKDPRTLKILTPPPMIVTFNDVHSESAGDISNFSIWFGLFPVRWVAAISEHENIPGFLDRQEIGPFEFWEHRHTFRVVKPGETEIVDQIRAKPGRFSLNGIISQFIWLTLPLLFIYRAWRTRRELEIITV